MVFQPPFPFLSSFPTRIQKSIRMIEITFWWCVRHISHCLPVALQNYNRPKKKEEEERMLKLPRNYTRDDSFMSSKQWAHIVSGLSTHFVNGNGREEIQTDRESTCYWLNGEKKPARIVWICVISGKKRNFILIRIWNSCLYLHEFCFFFCYFRRHKLSSIAFITPFLLNVQTHINPTKKKKKRLHNYLCHLELLLIF